jgi:hypothetical protein
MASGTQDIAITGLNLDIDPAIHTICAASNGSSNGTRSVLYLLTLVNILAITALINSYQFTRFSNWNSARVKKNLAFIAQHFSELDSLRQLSGTDTTTGRPRNTVSYYDSMVEAFNFDIQKKRLEQNIRHEMENGNQVKVPILGNYFDINDLGLVGGLSFLILMIIMSFMLSREANNLRLALRAINDRYIDEADEDGFADYIKKFITKNPAADPRDVLAKINQTRRQHHYNFLSMNEIYNLPPLEINPRTFRLHGLKKWMMKMFWLPLLVYLLIFANDISSYASGYEISAGNTVLLLSAEALFTFFLFFAATRCTKLKRDIYVLYSRFKKNEYSCS